MEPGLLSIHHLWLDFCVPSVFSCACFSKPLCIPWVFNKMTPCPSVLLSLSSLSPLLCCQGNTTCYDIIMNGYPFTTLLIANATLGFQTNDILSLGLRFLLSPAYWGRRCSHRSFSHCFLSQELPFTFKKPIPSHLSPQQTQSPRKAPRIAGDRKPLTERLSPVVCRLQCDSEYLGLRVNN